MIDALTDLRDSLENRRLQEITAAMIESIQGGKALSEAMRDFPYVFSTVFVNLVRAGEQSGTLTRVLRHMIDNLKWQDEQAAHTKRLFIYPVVVAVVVGGAMFSLMVFVVPELLKFVQSMGQELPLHTRILIAVSGAFASYWPFFLAALVSAILAILAGIKYSPGFRLWYDALVLGIPLFGVILKKLILTRISTYFALMYSSGITVLECMKVAEDIAGNRAVEEALRGAARQIGEGSGISCQLRQHGPLPAIGLAHAAGGREHRCAGGGVEQRQLFLYPRRAGIHRSATGPDRTCDDPDLGGAGPVGRPVGPGAHLRCHHDLQVLTMAGGAPPASRPRR